MSAGPEPLRLFDGFGPSEPELPDPRDGALDVLGHAIRRARSQRDLLARAKLMVDLEALARQAFEDAVAQAHAAGHSWRAVASQLGVPHQTLHRHCAGKEGDDVHDETTAARATGRT